MPACWGIIKKLSPKGRQEEDKKAETVISAPKKTEASNTTKNFEKILKKHKTFDNYVKRTQIDCQTARDKSIFVDYKGFVWPCCWQGHYYSSIGEDKGVQKRIDDRVELENKYGKDFNNLQKHSLFDILNTPYFSNDLVESWNDESKRLYICGKTCGKELDFRGNSEKNYEDTEMNRMNA